MGDCVNLTFVVQPWMIWTLAGMMLVSAVMSGVSAYYGYKIRRMNS